MSRRSSSRDRGVKEESVSPPPGSSIVVPAPQQHHPSPPGSPVMLTTMTPVSVIEFQKEYEEQQAAQQHHAQAPDSKIIYVHQPHDHEASDDMLLGENGQAYVGDDLEAAGVHGGPNHPQAYPGPQGTTILVLSELVDEMSPLLGLR
ncbi:hypothetical protein GE061_000292 [Apolygus lucorum]|uniref:Uncharacterized protein n=1 Tax=Apolygus lucorum TaxID=248454 RepID=A0A6A4KKE9_APOLU|nr:hypothetical protein GE061_000292 [Apolygus lucorum]